MELYTYFRSSAAWRVRIALALKGLDWTPRAVHMLKGGGEQKQPAYRAVNPQGLVPTLDIDGQRVTQSIAICELLEELYPEPPLLPADPFARAYVRSVMAAVACEIHPLNNLRVLEHVGTGLGLGQEGRLAWYRHWIADGFTRLEGLLADAGRMGRFTCGDTPGLGDAFLVPQVFNARRFDCPLDAFPRIVAIDAACAADPRFASAAPAAQADAE